MPTSVPTSLPTLSADLLSGQRMPINVVLPSTEMLALPERAVQFGTGAFLRGFVEFFVDSANRQGIFNGRIVAVGSTPSGRSDTLTAQNGLYTLVTEGIEHGDPVREMRVISALSRSLSAESQWNEVLKIARDPHIEIVFSNTTEIGIVLDETDSLSNGQAPKTFPGKLTAFLLERARHFGFSAESAVDVLPCELIEQNGQKLKGIVESLARSWKVEATFFEWIRDNVVFCDTLVDRIVSGSPDKERTQILSQELGYGDELITVCEPYRLFAIEPPAGSHPRLGFASADAGINITNDVSPYRLRKVRILNGAHSIMAPLALLAGKTTVFDAMSDSGIRSFIEAMIFAEIVPCVDAPQAEEFAREVLNRFSNPYLRHALFDITLHGTAKIGVRIVPSIATSQQRFGRVPELLTFGFAAFLYFMRGELQRDRGRAGLDVPKDLEGSAIQDAWQNVVDDSELDAFVKKICALAIWGVDLSAIPGYTDQVAADLRSIDRDGIRSAMESRMENALAHSGTETK